MRSSVRFDPAPLLVVDDDPAFRDAIGKLLRDASISVVAVHSGAAALDEVGARPFTAALVDAHMHPMDGFELALALLERAPGLPVVMISGMDPIEVVERAQSLGCHNVVEALPKPVYRRDLLHALGAARVRNAA